MALQPVSAGTSVIRSRWFVVTLGFALAVAVLAVSLLAQTPHPVSAQAAPAVQCNDDAASNVGGQGVACTVVITNNFAVGTGGTITTEAPSSLTMTRCTGAAGPVGAGAGTCVTTTVTSADPIALVQQCNGSANGGGGVLLCSVTVANVFSGSTVTTSPASVYQCVGSAITGPGAPGSCTPVNTPGVTSVTAATVGQCNSSGNGGTSVGFTCTVSTDSTMNVAFGVNVDQCNGSSNGGGALTICSATVTNEFVMQVATPSPTPSPTATPSATASPSATAGPSASGTPSPPTTATPSSPDGPTPGDTGNAGLTDGGGTSTRLVVVLGALAVALAFVGRRAVRSRPRRGQW
jgi:hypothetical protein